MASILLNRRLVLSLYRDVWTGSQRDGGNRGPHQIPWLRWTVLGLPRAVAAAHPCQHQAGTLWLQLHERFWMGLLSCPPLTCLIITRRGTKAIAVLLNQLSCGVICYTTADNSSTWWDTGLSTVEYKPQGKFMHLSSQRNSCYSCSSGHVRILHQKWKTSFYILPNC